MQIERRPISAQLEQPSATHGEKSEIRRRTGEPSVWIDPVVQQNVFAAYIEHEPRPFASATKDMRTGPLEHSPVSDKLPAETTHSAHSTHSPIPPRASAQRSGLGNLHPRYTRVTAKLPELEESDVTRIPTLPPPTMWQYSSPGFAAESSLSALSLLEQPTPQFFNDVSMLPTRIMPKQAQDIDIEEIATQPPTGRPASSNHSQPLTFGQSSGPLRSWTAGEGANSYYAKYIAGYGRDKSVPTWGKFRNLHRTPSLRPTERLRWWLLYPGRIEFLCWFGGTLLLMAVTCIFLFVSLVSMGWLGMVHTSASSSTPQQHCASQQNCRASFVVVIKPQLVLVTHTQIIPGMLIRLQGQGFSHNGRVMLTHDAGLACEPASIQANTQGNFTLEMPIGANWAVGKHMLKAYDAQSKQQATLLLLLAPASTGNAVTPASTTTTTITTPPPVITATIPSGIGSGLLPTPIETPIPIVVTPTVGITPTPVPATPTPKSLTPTPTPKVPTPTPIPKSLTPTPTVKPTPAVTPTVSHTPTATTQGIVAQSLVPQDGMPAGTSSLPLLLLALCGYATALLLLVLAGFLHHRNRAHQRKQ